jgi:flagellar hook-length control protein FliK
MQNIQMICEKILSGPTTQVLNPAIQVDTGFLDILASLTQDTDSNLIELPMMKDSKSEEKVEVTDEMIQKALMHLLISNGSAPINDKVQITNEELSKIENILKLNHTNQNQMIEFSQGDQAIENGNLVNEKEFKLNEMISLNPEKIVIETGENNEIQKHYRVLNQPIRLKEIIKNDEFNSINQTIKPEFELSKEVKLTNLQMNEFKQSIQEMQAVIEGMSKKEDQTIVFKLKPEGLAEIVIKFEQKLGKVVLDISTPNKMVEQLIQKELPNLRDSLKSFQMEVNLNEMSFKNHSGQSQQPKYFQERQVVQVHEEDLIEETIVLVPQSYGFNTYV